MGYTSDMHTLHKRILGTLHNSRTLILFGVCLALLAILSIADLSARTSHRSVELSFKDPSLASNLGIIPASCPSDPHSDGECAAIGYVDSVSCNGPIKGWAADTANSDVPLTMYFYADASPTANAYTSPTPFGQATANEYRADLCTAYGCNHGFTYPTLPASLQNGSHDIYIMTYNTAAVPNQLPNSPIHIQCDGSPCSDGSTPVNGVCPVAQHCPDGATPVNNQCPTTGTCPLGYTPASNGQCTSTSCIIFFGIPLGNCAPATQQCTAPSFALGNQCVQCVSGSTWNGSSCAVTLCPSGFTLVGGVCQQTIVTQCPAGFISVNGACQQQCSFICQNGNLVNQCNNQVTTCSNGCSVDSCIVIPGITVQKFTARPPIVKKGDAGTIAWSVTNAKSCVVVGSNGDTWTGLTGNLTTSAITAQTIFTLTCVPLNGALGVNGAAYVWSDLHQTINIAPIFQEQ
ncbi:MAG: hypothetical protein JWO50_362 [Candidatus Kaiserbacteria bacterium]|nr:hypothetical protein [Candidatus Kaiserbacteria bacterium]